jgi:polysaccharide export outer membrane protein
MKSLLVFLALSAVALAQDAAPLPGQKVGPNDLLAVSVYDAPEFTRSIRVSPEGDIRLPMVRRRIPVAGLTPSAIEDAIAAALVAEQILVDPIVSVSVAEYHSRPISVAGSVKAPITFQADQPVTLLEAITRAGGLAPGAGLEILVSYNQPAPDGTNTVLTRRIPINGLIDQADPALNIRLNGGEEVRVPEIGKVYVVGNVKKPGAFPVQGDNDTTVLQMLAMAEGLAPYAAKEAYIVRLDDRTGKKNEIPVPLDKIMKRKAPDVPLLANDIFYIPDNAGKRTKIGVLEKVAAFGAATASGLIIWGTR